jgi:hypothetical protein
MTKEVCDLCGEPIVVGETPTYGGQGSKARPEHGPEFGNARHYHCHTERWPPARSFGEIKADIDGILGKLKEGLTALDRLRVKVSDVRPGGEPIAPYVAQGACGRCGRYSFNHPTPECGRWEPPREQWDG